jgi:hypothetical protein
MQKVITSPLLLLLLQRELAPGPQLAGPAELAQEVLLPLRLLWPPRLRRVLRAVSALTLLHAVHEEMNLQV